MMQYRLSKIVTSGSTHINLSTSSGVNIDLIESTPIYCKIDTLGKEAPIKISIEYRDRKEGDFKVFVSDKSSEPNESNSIYQFHN